MQLQVNFWDQAFQAAGFPAGTLHAEVCPEGIDPYDIDGTFSYVEWVHRCVQQLVGLGCDCCRLCQPSRHAVTPTVAANSDHRSWSYGPSIADPRTGEILKGHVILGSLRGRQDALMGLGLIQPYRHASQGSPEAATLFAEIESAVLQRHRQLAAHEVGHSLGLAHK